MRRAGITIVLGLCLVASRASATDLGNGVRLDVTSTTSSNYHFDNRNDSGPADVANRIDDNYGEILERLNVALAYQSWQAGLRWDTATYYHRPTADQFPTQQLSDQAAIKLAFRYRDQYVEPIGGQKLYVTYSKPWLEATLGDSYVSFGRGLVLSIRKIDELAADTSVQGAKVVGRFSPLNFTLVGGLSNPVRIDEATAVALRDPKFADPSDAKKFYSQDIIAGGRVEARVGPSTFGLHAADVHRLDDLSSSAGEPTMKAKDITGVGGSIAMPRIAQAFPVNLFAEFAVQNLALWKPEQVVDSGSSAPSNHWNKTGYAAYLSLSGTAGIVTTTFEGKHYRGLYPIHINADPSQFSPYNAVQYNAPPTAELITQDSLFDDACVTGGRLRFDVKPRKDFFFYVSGAYFANWGEIAPGTCTAGLSLGMYNEAHHARNDTFDGYVGVDFRSPKDASYLIVTAGVRDDRTVDSQPGDPTRGIPADLPNGLFYHEGWIEADGQVVLGPKWSLELDTWHRDRSETQTNETWREGQTYFNVKYTSDYAFYVGHEYTTRPSIVKRGAFLVDGGTQHYLNLGAQLKFGDHVQLRLFAGEQRGALKCVSGVCRFFPAFEGLKSELVLRY